MAKNFSLIISFSLLLLTYGCNKRNHPSRALSEINAGADTAKSAEVIAAKKPVIKPTKKDIIPEIIVINDTVARKSIDGRLYYDLLGHRYWKNYKDGKYYLFNKSMYTNDAFKIPRL